MINRETFFSYVRRNPFGGSVSPQQADGLTRILDYWEKNYSGRDIRFLAYILATVFHETASTMQPVEEYGGKKYLKSKPYYPWYGRGLVQITWKENYQKYGISDPNQALEWPTALKILFDGMIHGKFTGHRLSQYFSDAVEKPKEARKIVNKMDKAGLIADYYTAFLGALKPAQAETPPEDVTPEATKPDTTPATKDPQIIVTTGAGALASIIAAVTSPWGAAAFTVLVIALGIGAFLYFRNKEKWEKG